MPTDPPPDHTALSFEPDPVDLTPLRRTLRRVAAAHPDRVIDCTRIIEAAIADLEAVAVAPRVASSVLVSPDRSVTIDVEIDRRHRTRTGGYWQMPFHYRGGLSPLVKLAMPPLAAWTPATVADLITQMRGALRARGATGSGKVSAQVGASTFSRPDQAALDVHIGHLRASTIIDVGFGCSCLDLPTEMITALHQAVPRLKLKSWLAREHASAS